MFSLQDLRNLYSFDDINASNTNTSNSSNNNNSANSNSNAMATSSNNSSSSNNAEDDKKELTRSRTDQRLMHDSLPRDTLFIDLLDRFGSQVIIAELNQLRDKAAVATPNSNSSNSNSNSALP